MTPNNTAKKVTFIIKRIIFKKLPHVIDVYNCTD